MLIVGATALVALMAPATTLAGTYSWRLPDTFTAAAPGANPDHDAYGATPWSYADASTPSGSALASPNPAPTAFRVLGSFSANLPGGLPGWSDSLDVDHPFVARNAGAGRLELQPASDRVVAVGWTSPLAHAATVSVTGTFVPDGSCGLLPPPPPTWALVENGSSVASGSGSSTISASPTVPAGATIYLAVDYAGGQLAYSAACDRVGITVQIQAIETAAPTVTLGSPANGGLVPTALPTFSGAASSGFGASRSVTVRIYQGSSVSGSPVQTLSATRSGSVYLIGASAPLPDGAYTAVAEQDDLSTPADAGLSPADAFVVKAGSSAVTIDQPPAGANTTDPNPLLGGAASDSSRVTVTLYAGGFASGKPLASAEATATGGRWSLRWPNKLAPGIYTAVATQIDGSGQTASSGPHSFLIVPAAGSGGGSARIGSPVTITRGGIAAIAISCPPGAGRCAGTVLILTAKSFQAVSGGPAGRLRVMFAYVAIPAGRTVAVRRRVQPSVLRVLRRARHVGVRVLASFGSPASATRTLRIARH